MSSDSLKALQFAGICIPRTVLASSGKGIRMKVAKRFLCFWAITTIVTAQNELASATADASEAPSSLRANGIRANPEGSMGDLAHLREE